MIAHLEGRVRTVSDNDIVVMCAGVGYAVTTCGFAVFAGQDVEIYVHSITKETGTTLYGFATWERRNRFVEMLAVDGVGPKTALAIVAAGVDRSDVAALCSVKGVGKKTAEKIVEHFGAAA